MTNETSNIRALPDLKLQSIMCCLACPILQHIARHCFVIVQDVIPVFHCIDRYCTGIVQYVESYRPVLQFIARSCVAMVRYLGFCQPILQCIARYYLL